MTPAPGATAPARPRGPVHVRGEVVATKRVGAYQQLGIVAPGVAERARAGTFVALTVGAPSSALLRRRVLWIHRVRPSSAYGGTVEVVVDPCGPGTRELAGLRQHDPVDLIAPLGRPYALPREPVTCALVGVEYASAPLFLLAERLRERGCVVHMVLGASSESRLLGTLDARRTARSVTVTTADGSVGLSGRVADPLPDLLRRTAAAVVYAAGPAADLRGVAAAAAAHGAWSHCAVQPEMACGTGLCQGCTVPVTGDDGITRQLRACVDGPALRGDQVHWEALTGAG